MLIGTIYLNGSVALGIGTNLYQYLSPNPYKIVGVGGGGVRDMGYLPLYFMGGIWEMFAFLLHGI